MKKKEIDPCKEPYWLDLMIDGELSPEDAAYVTGHLRHCPACRRRLRRLEQADDFMRRLPKADPSESFDRTFWQKVELLEDRKRRRGGWRCLLSGWRPILVGGMAGLAVFAIFAVGHQSSPTPEEAFIAENIELLDDFEVIHNLDILESWEILEAMEERS